MTPSRTNEFPGEDPRSSDEMSFYLNCWDGWVAGGLAHLSSNSSLVVANGVGHEIQTNKPEIVVNAIERLVMQWRATNR